MKPLRTFSLLCSALLLFGACKERRAGPPDPAPTYHDVAPLLTRACLACHNADDKAGGYSVADYWASIGCTRDGRVVTQPADERAPLIQVLERADHQGLVSQDGRDLLLAWVSAETPAQRSVIHAPGILDPRREGWHGQLAAQDGYQALRVAEAELACGRCHQGAPVAPEGKTGNTDGATPCTSCHTEPEGALACSTCHGNEGRSYPPRDACYFDAPKSDPHAAHVAEPHVRSEPFACNTCHPLPSDDLFAAPHADGHKDVQFASPPLDATSVVNTDGSCSVACHTRGGQRSEPDWKVEAQLDCQSCHLSPPTNHSPGPCGTCHSNMGDSPESLVLNALHIDGKVELGDGSNTCGSCHGKSADGAPADVSHQQHLGSPLTVQLVCTDCHRTPTLDDLRAPDSHMNGIADVTLGARALSGSHAASYDASQKTCTNVACHGQTRFEPRWGAASLASRNCVACHQTPPPPPHSTLPGCGGGLCHGSEVAPTSSGFHITESGRPLHIDGVVQAGSP